MSEAYELFGCNSSELFVISVDYNDTDAEVLQFHNTYNLEFPAISGIEGGGNAIRSDYGVLSFPTYILIAPNHDIVEQDMWPISGTQNFIDYFENNGLVQSPCGPPSCTQAILPQDLAMEVPTNINFEWESIAGATGYTIYLGTDYPPTSIENGTDLGAVTTYSPPADLEYETDYFWQIVPYNFAGMPGSCEVFQFTTKEHAVSLNLKAFLEGPFNIDQMNPDLNSLGFLPLAQPYNIPPWNYMGTEFVSTIPVNAVDWVLIDILKPYGNGENLKFELLNRAAGFIMNDGTIKDFNGINNVSMPLDISVTQFHVRIQHRNHMPVVSLTSLLGFNQTYTYDFTTASDQAWGGTYALTEVTTDTWAMIAADGNASLQIDNSDKNEVWSLQLGMKGYFNGDFNMDSDVNINDKILSWQLNLGRGAYPVQDTVPGK